MGSSGYLLLCQEGRHSAHRYALKMTHISLDAAHDALGYRALLLGDSAVQAAVTGYGFTMGAQLERTYQLSGQPSHGDFTLRLKGILAADGGETPITGTAFVRFATGQIVTTDSCQTTMRTVLETVDRSWSSFNASQQASVQALYRKFQQILSGWELNHINQ